MSEQPSIYVRDVVKRYRRFSHPGWRALNALGMPVPKDSYDEFVALHDISFDLRQGDRVALIGRNGAGKSTLLRIISGLLKPDEGEVRVRGKCQVLMELGTGFHPDFSGIQNIRSALSLNGIVGDEGKRLLDEIIDFSELENFIHRPIREYSAGMYARLAFAVATAVKPEVLIIDEILGAGDAYFVGKCLNRIKGLAAGGTTLLFVSHDMSSVQLLCERAIWIHHGRVKMMGSTLDVSKAYLAYIREEEEVRLKAKAMELNKKEAARFFEGENLLFRLILRDGTAPSKPVWISRILHGGSFGVESSLHVAEGERDSDEGLIISAGYTNWGPPATYRAQACRAFKDVGGLYIHAPWAVRCVPDTQEFWVQIEYANTGDQDVLVEVFNPDVSEYVCIGHLPPSPEGAWALSPKMNLPEEMISGYQSGDNTSVGHLDLQELDAVDRYGSGEAIIESFAFVSDDGKRMHTLVSGERVEAAFSICVEDRICDPVAVIAFYRPDGTCASQLISRRDGVEFGALSGKCVIKMTADRLVLGPGDYLVSVALFKDLDLASSCEPEAYDLHDRCYPVKVLSPIGIGVEIGIANQQAEWAVIHE